MNYKYCTIDTYNRNDIILSNKYIFNRWRYHDLLDVSVEFVDDKVVVKGEEVKYFRGDWLAINESNEHLFDESYIKKRWWRGRYVTSGTPYKKTNPFEFITNQYTITIR